MKAALGFANHLEINLSQRKGLLPFSFLNRNSSQLLGSSGKVFTVGKRALREDGQAGAAQL